MLEFFLRCYRGHQHSHQKEISASSQDTDRATSAAAAASASASAAGEGYEVSVGSFRVFSLQDLKIATHNFHSENKLGGGGFGWVFKGVLEDGTEVAVKQLSLASRQGKTEFLNEVNLLTTVQHRNLVKLLGCCADGSERLLVYEYLQNMSLDRFLFGPRSKNSLLLEWSIRRRIIVGTAKGLSYLHEDSRVRIIHRDIKASNILLDDKFRPKIADFGLAKLVDLEQTHATTKVAGTFGYLAPEYALNGKLTEKADVYSFGVVMLEIVSGRKHVDFELASKNQRLLEVAWRRYRQQRLLKLADSRMGDSLVPEEVVRVAHVALLCTQAAPDLRPSMSRVVALLAGRSQIAEKPTIPPFISEERASKPQRRALHGLGEAGSSATSASSAKGNTSSSFFSP